jgi:hypothetical protein
MKRILPLAFLVSSLMLASPVAGQSAPAEEQQFLGMVSAVATDTFTIVTAERRLMTFAVDRETQISVRNRTHLIPIPPATVNPKPRVLAEYLKRGDRAVVLYREVGPTNYAIRVQVTPPPAR